VNDAEKHTFNNIRNIKVARFYVKRNKMQNAAKQFNHLTALHKIMRLRIDANEKLVAKASRNNK